MKERFFVIFIILGIASFSVFIFVDSRNDLSNRTFITKGTIETKQLVTLVPVENSQAIRYDVNCTNGCCYEIKNNAFLSNCTELYNSLEENATYTFTVWLDLKNGVWNIVAATKIR